MTASKTFAAKRSRPFGTGSALPTLGHTESGARHDRLADDAGGGAWLPRLASGVASRVIPSSWSRCAMPMRRCWMRARRHWRSRRVESNGTRSLVGSQPAARRWTRVDDWQGVGRGESLGEGEGRNRARREGGARQFRGLDWTARRSGEVNRAISSFNGSLPRQSARRTMSSSPTG